MPNGSPAALTTRRVRARAQPGRRTRSFSSSPSVSCWYSMTSRGVRPLTDTSSSPTARPARSAGDAAVTTVTLGADTSPGYPGRPGRRPRPRGGAALTRRGPRNDRRGTVTGHPGAERPGAQVGQRRTPMRTPDPAGRPVRARATAGLAAVALAAVVASGGAASGARPSGPTRPAVVPPTSTLYVAETPSGFGDGGNVQVPGGVAVFDPDDIAGGPSTVFRGGRRAGGGGTPRWPCSGAPWSAWTPGADPSGCATWSPRPSATWPSSRARSVPTTSTPTWPPPPTARSSTWSG